MKLDPPGRCYSQIKQRAKQLGFFPWAKKRTKDEIELEGEYDFGTRRRFSRKGTGSSEQTK
jgi:hypothetical protein